MLKTNAQGYSRYEEIREEIEPHTDSDRKETVARDVHSELIDNVNLQNPSNLEPLIQILHSLSRYLNQSEGQQMMERLSNRLNDGNLNANQKSTLIDLLSGFEDFFGKERQMVDRIENLLSQTNNSSIQRSTKQLLKTLERKDLEKNRVGKLREKHFSKEEEA